MKLVYSYIKIGAALCYLLTFAHSANSQSTIAREWNEILLEAIRNDFARPTVHARNLYHHSIITYDAWALYDQSKETYFTGKTIHGYNCEFMGVNVPLDLKSAREEAISYGSFYFIKARYQNSPDYYDTYLLMYDLMTQHGYNINNTSTDYVNGGPAELGNYIAQELINYGYSDGSNELINYENAYYTPFNPPLVMSEPGNPHIIDPNRWQQLTLDSAIDQSGNLVQNTIPFISPEWGNVDPFALNSSMYNVLSRDGQDYNVYFDTVQPAYLNLNDSSSWESFYKWNHSLVSIWQSQLDPTDGVIWDISPASIGNNTWYPADSSEYPAFYNLLDGGDPSTGYSLNPVTGLPYVPQEVPRGDYARVLAEFWADGIDSETPPGHWFEIYHYVTDQPSFERKWTGVGPVIDTLEYDVKAHLTLGGAMHDAAISAWSLKGYYDYIRPVSSIRYMVTNGQSTDSLLPSYHPNGIPLLQNYIELVDSLDPLAGAAYENVGKIKLYTWKGHDYINDPLIDLAGAGWILGEHWWPYQRPTFVTPPFAGFVSGHSTFSRAAAGILENITGSPYFPAGLGEFTATQNEFLHFEEGPSITITLQWASYRDAADQCSLSRIWGGIHPPIDDIPGRMIGEQIGAMCFNRADSIFSLTNETFTSVSISDTIINSYDAGSTINLDLSFNTPMDIGSAPQLTLSPVNLYQVISIDQIYWIDSFHVQIEMGVNSNILEQYASLIQIEGLNTAPGLHLDAIFLEDFIIVDTKLPEIITISNNTNVISDEDIPLGFETSFQLNEACRIDMDPGFLFSGIDYLNPTIVYEPTGSGWSSNSEYTAGFNVFDYNEEISSVDLMIENIEDLYGNPILNPSQLDLLAIDTENPALNSVTLTDSIINIDDLMSNPIFESTLVFNENMDTTFLPEVEFYNGPDLHATIAMNPFQSYWSDSSTLISQIWVLNDTNNLISLDLICISAKDKNGNLITDSIVPSAILSDLKRPSVEMAFPVKQVVSDSLIGSMNYYVDISFDEQMDTGALPLILHNANQNIGGSIQYDLSESLYLDSVTYRAFFNIIDENIEVDTIDLTIIHGNDFSGNTQVLFEEDTFISLDTKNPAISNFNINPGIINPGEQLEISFTFDEEMDTNQLVNLNFDPQILSPVILTQSNYVWADELNLFINYDLISSDINPHVYNLSVDNGIDKAGNLLIQYDSNSVISIPGSVHTNGIELNSIQVYPNLISSGENIRIKGINNEAALKHIKLFNSDGKSTKQIKFKQSGQAWSSNPLYIEPGMYYIIIENISYRFVVI